MVAQVAGQRGVAGDRAGEVVVVEERQVVGVGGDGVDGADGGHRGPLDAGAVLSAAVGDPAVAEGVREDVGRHDAVDPAHHQERRPHHLGIGFEPEGGRHGGARGLTHQAHHLELHAQLVAREHRQLVELGLDAGHAAAGDHSICGGPRRREEAVSYTHLTLPTSDLV